jgi:hypothetical protein
MAAFIDVFQCSIPFTVNIALPYVEAIDTNVYMEALDGFPNSALEFGDNPEILSIGVKLPNGYSEYMLSDRPYKKGLQIGLESTGSSLSAGFTNTYLPFDSYELSTGNFPEIPWDFFLSSTPVKVLLQFLNTTVDMSGVPATEDGKIYFVDVFVKIRHTKRTVSL